MTSCDKYYYKDTVVVDEALFEWLKKLYIGLFGGWERIDLDHTKYNGKKWWRGAMSAMTAVMEETVEKTER